MKTLHTWTLIIGLITGPLLLGQDQPVAHIDPLAPNLLRFLDSDLEEFQWRAGQAYGRGDYLNAARWYIALVQHRTDEIKPSITWPAAMASSTSRNWPHRHSGGPSVQALTISNWRKVMMTLAQYDHTRHLKP